MIDPYNFTNYELDDAGLQEYILFGIAVANKNAKVVSERLFEFLESYGYGVAYFEPFQVIKSFGNLNNLIEAWKKFKVGSYYVKAKGFWWIANSGLNLKSCTVDQLEQCPGIGFKTSRFFILHTRENPDPPVACPDTHIRKWLAEQAGDSFAARKYVHPNSKDMKEHERNFINIAQCKGLSVAELDLQIWRMYRKDVKTRRERDTT